MPEKPIEISSPDSTETIQVTQEVFGAIEETAGILASPELMDALNAPAEDDDYIPWAEVKKSIGL
ncbi:MAG: hypothetical protein KGL39_17045 [Patescibacteria group bacterium]|nr:hypothetical protein [Patescibacteria group bacterium]